MHKGAVIAVLALSSIVGVGLGRYVQSVARAPNAAPVASIPPTSILCGPQSLWAASLRMGEPVDWNRLLSAANVKADGTSFASLKSAADSIGLDSSIRRLRWDELRSLGGTAILFVGDNHFVAVDPREADPKATGPGTGQLRVYDPDRPARWWTREELEKSWDGATLTLSPKASASRDGLTWETCLVDLGHLRSQEKAEYHFPFRNPTSGPIAIEVAGTTCGCTIPRLSTSTLGPGEVGELFASVDVRNKRGRYTEKVQVTWTSAGSSGGRAELILAGGVLSNTITSVEKIHFGEVLPGRPLQKRFFLHDPGDGNLSVRRSEFHLDGTPGDIQEASAIVNRVDRGSPLIGVDGRYPVREGDYCVDVTIPIGTESNTRVLEGRVIFETSLEGALSRLEIPFHAEVRPSVEAEPKALMVSGRSEKVQVVRVTLTSLDGQRPDLVEATVDEGAPVKFGEPEPSGTAGLIVPVEVSPSPGSGKVAEYSLRFKTRTGVSLKVPLIIVQ